jgi:hypothetical protein
MNRLKNGSIAVGAPGSEARRRAEIEDEADYFPTHFICLSCECEFRLGSQADNEKICLRCEAVALNEDEFEGECYE